MSVASRDENGDDSCRASSGYLVNQKRWETCHKRATHNRVITTALTGMMISLAIAYALILLLFLILGYTTTPRRRLHLGLFSVASIFWPVALVAVIGAVVAEKLGVLSKARRSGRRMPAASEPSAARARVSVLGR